jgi:hypothetical protein
VLGIRPERRARKSPRFAGRARVIGSRCQPLSLDAGVVELHRRFGNWEIGEGTSALLEYSVYPGLPGSRSASLLLKQCARPEKAVDMFLLVPEVEVSQTGRLEGIFPIALHLPSRTRGMG